MRATSIIEAVVAAAVCFFVVSRCDRRAERRKAEENSPPSAVQATGESVVSGKVAKRTSPRKVVRQFLRENGLREGFSEDKGTVVVVLKEPTECPASDPSVISDAREKCFAGAIKKAKVSIGEVLSDALPAEDLRKLRHSQSETSSDDGTGEISNAWKFSMALGGFSLLTQAEDWNPDKVWEDESHPGVYEVAVAVAWNRSSHERIASESGAGAKTGVRVSKNEFNAWLAEQNREMLIGPKTVKDAAGRFHYLGVGVADGEGRRARERAELSARSFAVFPLFSKVGSAMVLKTRIDSDENAVSEDFEIVYTDELMNEDHVRFVVLDNFTSINPDSGRKQTSVVVEAFP